jgi:competence protein ComFC
LKFLLTSLESWFSSNKQACAACGQLYQGNSADRVVPVRNPHAKAVLSGLCGSCYRHIPWIAYPACRVCGRDEKCEDCGRRQTQSFIQCRCAVRYDDEMKDWLALYKYRGSERLEPVLSALLAYSYERLCDEMGQPVRSNFFQAIVPVPLAPERLRERGFNQAERMARRLAGWYGLRCEPLLIRLRHTEKQSLKGRRSRVLDMRGNFAATSEAESMKGLNPILIVDDVYTTGSTLNECARVLSESDEHCKMRIYGLAWARA